MLRRLVPLTGCDAIWAKGCEQTYGKDAVNVVSGKWKLAIVCALLQSGQRFSDLERLLGFVTSRTLSKDLKNLELNGIVSRESVRGSNSSAVVYELTDSGRSLEKVIMEMASWGQVHRQEVRSKNPAPCSGSFEVEH